jgi:hypothetical protein
MRFVTMVFRFFLLLVLFQEEEGGEETVRATACAS